MDKNVSISCTEQLFTCIKEYCLRKIKNENLREKFFKIPIDSIITQVKEQFGYFLPYLILTRSKRIKKIKFERLLDKNYNIQDTISIRVSDYC